MKKAGAKPDAELRRKVLRDPVLLLAFGFGTGLAPRAPGTVGSLLGIPLAWGALGLEFHLQLILAAVLFAAGIWLCGEAGKRLAVHDHPGIVWDEIVAMYLVLIALPVSFVFWIAGYLLFRLFDIWKPWPIRDLDHRLGGGLGTMLDDLFAALYAALLLGFGRWLMF
ncbi:MAG TPA: phosphatidylglycerophosphatase A [Woeseiaceae bacterium]|nr:phosphatidylglycerophosphatase A [Woeseiaceae bacterium]